ncbi:MAG: T9SS type A sorting domain-containing protein [Bacteroidetes bacterium]|nr:T9SS type A sorting domain-containing protein [Bacteroidota bacterium]
MKKSVVVLLIIHCTLQMVHAQTADQKRNMHWYFGVFAGLDFTSGTAVADTNGQISTLESTAVISDTNGILQCYFGYGYQTNYDWCIYNREHKTMPNGCGIGNGNSTPNDCAVFIPKPGDDSTYFLFTVDGWEGQFMRGLRWHEIDMRQDSGRGDVVSKDNVFLQQINLIDSTVKYIVLQINDHDSLELIGNTNLNMATRENYILQLSTEIENRNLLFAQRETFIVSLLNEAATRLGQTSTSETPLMNDKTVYEIELDYHTYGESVIENHMVTLYSIAVQCPYSAGNAVYKARAWLENLYDSLYWDDANVCFNEGIYRQSNLSNLPINSNIIVRPNPSSGIVEIVKSRALQSNCSVSIKNSVGKIVFEQAIDCKQGSQFIDVSKLANGVYTITIVSEQTMQLNQKLIIMK